ncbi:MAG: ubiquinol-cytochrome c reductase iron-sulfur subunit [Nitrospirae bacterium]|nr:MAG: ubiquinol-cytochrome c reductase iron-sulfur subunit [Nitrospirota bacterium]
MHTAEPEGRRTFLAWVSGSIAAMIGLTVGIPLIGYTILPALKRRKPEWTEIGTVDDLQPEAPKEMTCMYSVADGWQKTTVRKTVWAVKRRTGEITVYSPLCTHLGCGYRWEPERHQFHCPCHNSIFAIDGSVLAGPAPRPLDTLPVKVERGRIWVIYKEFKAGTSVKIEL